MVIVMSGSQGVELFIEILYNDCSVVVTRIGNIEIG